MNTITKYRNAVGVWLDHRHAKVIDTNEESIHVREFESGIESHVRHEGEVSDVAHLAKLRVINSESRKNRRRESSIQSFYKMLANEIKPWNEILILGPTTAPKEFENFLTSMPNFTTKSISLQSTDYLTDNQIVHTVRKHFEK